MLGELATQEQGAIRIGPFGSTLKKHEYAESGVRVLGIEDVIPNKLVSHKQKFIPHAKFRELSQYTVKPGDILVTNMGTVGRTCVVPDDLETSIISSHLIKVTLDQRRAWPGYISWMLNCCPLVVAQIEADCHGAIMSGFNSSLLKQLRIPLPPLAEQRRIAEVLDRSEALRAKRRAALAQLDMLSRAIFLDLFGDPMTNPNGWPRARIDQIGDVITGNTPSRARAEYFGNAIEWVKADNLIASNYYATRAEEGLSHAGKALARIAPAQSILVTCIAGSPASIGNAAMTDREVAFNQQINAFVPRHGDPDFFYAQIVIAKRLVQQVSTAAMKGMVSKSRFQQIRLISPPLTLQRQFARSAAVVERLKGAHRASLAEMDALFASLQYRAFRGEL